MQLRLPFLWLSIISCVHLQCIIEAYKFALVPKRTNSIFFDASKVGCMDRAKFLTKTEGMEIECIYIGPSDFDPNGTVQAQIVQDLIDQGDIDGISISILQAEPMRPVIQNAIEKGIPVVTFDSDDPESGRASYIGTDNFFFGEQLGKVLQKVRPQGGNYMIVSDETPNVISREKGVRSSLQQEAKTDWNELDVSPLDAKGNYTYAIELMRTVLRSNSVTAVIPVFGGPMFLGDLWVDLVDEFPDVTFVVADGLQVQLDLLARGKVDGLVAQLPYNMGSMSMDSLLSLKQQQSAGKEFQIPNFQGTNVLEHVVVPLVLPELTVDQNYLGYLRYVGFALYGIIACTSVFFLGWTYANRSNRVVKSAQPGFLALVAIGVLIMGGSLISLSFDDSSTDYSEEKGNIRCMSIPWFIFMGFTLIYSALFAKLWRINQLVESISRFKRVPLNVTQVIMPMAILLAANAATLIWWSLKDPSKYKRIDLRGTDAWNRVVATYGTCASKDPIRYSLVLGFLNVGVLLIASWQAYKARKIKSEFAESKYVAMALVSMLQVFLIGFPLLWIVRTDPRAYYWTMSLMVFITCMMVLLVIFVPKFLQFQENAPQDNSEQRHHIVVESSFESQNKLDAEDRKSKANSLMQKPDIISRSEDIETPESSSSLTREATSDQAEQKLATPLHQSMLVPSFSGSVGESEKQDGDNPERTTGAFAFSFPRFQFHSSVEHGASALEAISELSVSVFDPIQDPDVGPLEHSEQRWTDSQKSDSTLSNASLVAPQRTGSQYHLNGVGSKERAQASQGSESIDFDDSESFEESVESFPIEATAMGRRSSGGNFRDSGSCASSISSSCSIIKSLEFELDDLDDDNPAESKEEREQDKDNKYDTSADIISSDAPQVPMRRPSIRDDTDVIFA